jgi:hypothetical protein
VRVRTGGMAGLAGLFILVPRCNDLLIRPTTSSICISMQRNIIASRFRGTRPLRLPGGWASGGIKNLDERKAAVRLLFLAGSFSYALGCLWSRQFIVLNLQISCAISVLYSFRRRPRVSARSGVRPTEPHLLNLRPPPSLSHIRSCRSLYISQ